MWAPASPELPGFIKTALHHPDLQKPLSQLLLFPHPSAFFWLAGELYDGFLSCATGMAESTHSNSGNLLLYKMEKQQDPQNLSP